jgi:hypothetical protein
MSGYGLRPLTLGELLDRAFLLYRRNFWHFFGIMAIPACLIIPMQFFYLRSRGAPFLSNRPSPQAHITAHAFGDLFVYWIVYSVVQAAMTHAVADAYVGRSSTVREAYGKIRGRLWKVIGVTLGAGIRVFGLTLLLILLALIVGVSVVAAVTSGNVPSSSPIVIIVAVVIVSCGIAFGLWVSVRYAVSLPVVLLEEITARAAIRRSVQLSRGRRGQIFVAILFGIVVSYAAAMLFQGPFYAAIFVMRMTGHLPNWLILAMSVSGSIGGAVAGPLLMIVLVLCYYDLRIRKEGFDLQHMMTLLPDPKPADAGSLT